MSGINRVFLIGRLGQDPKLSHLQDGTAVANFSIATSESWKDKQTNEKKEKTEWHSCQAWRGLAEVCGKYLKKGSQVFIEGKQITRSYEKDGDTRYVTETVINNLEMLGGKREPESQDQPAQQKASYKTPILVPVPEPDDVPF